MSGWSSPSWNWGSAVGDAHNEAMRIRGALRDEELRRQWLVSMIGGSSAVEWEVVVRPQPGQAATQYHQTSRPEIFFHTVRSTTSSRKSAQQLFS